MSLLLEPSEISQTDIARYLNDSSDSSVSAILVVEISNYLNRVEAAQYTIFTQKFHNSVSKTLKQFNGQVVKNDNNTYLIFFATVSDAVLCGQQIQYKFKYVTPKHQAFKRRLNIAISGGEPLTNPSDFKDAIRLAYRMCEVVNSNFVITSEIRSQYERENENALIDKDQIRALQTEEVDFLDRAMDTIEKNWSKSSFNAGVFHKTLGLTRSQLYRRIRQLSGKSPNKFIREFRLHKALLLMHLQKGNISQIAKKSGFQSVSYFSKRFFKSYGILPSKYVQQHIY